MTWDELIPLPISSLAVFLLVAVYVLPVGFAMAVKLWQRYRLWAGAGMYFFTFLTALNALVVYGYTPNQIDSRLWKGNVQGAYHTGERWILFSGIVTVGVTIVFMLTMVLLPLRKQRVLWWLCTATLGPLVLANETYNQYDQTLLAWLRNNPSPPPLPTWEVCVLLGWTVACTLVALYFALRGLRWHGFVRWLLYHLQFCTPPQPPDYRYHKMEEF
jgi:hypothetical protein